MLLFLQSNVAIGFLKIRVVPISMEKNLVLYDALRLETDAKTMERELIVAITQSKISSSCYAFKSRVKPEGKLYEKLCRKQKTKPSYKLTDITDVIGLRLVTLFRKEMPDVLENVIALIAHENNRLFQIPSG